MYTGFPKGAYKIRSQSLDQAIKKSSAWLAAIVLSLFCTSEAQGASGTLAWNPSPSPGVIGYNLCYGPSTHNYTNIVDVGNSTSFCLFGLVVGDTYCIAVTAYNNVGLESVPSDEVVYTVPDGEYRPKFESGSSLKISNGSFSFALGADPG